MSYLLNKKLEHETACETAIRTGDTRKAIFHAAKAAEFAFALAEHTGGAIAKRYIEDAEGWLEIAERLEKEPLPRHPSSPDSRPSSLSSSSSPRPPTLAPAASSSEGADSSSFSAVEKPNIAFNQIAGMLDAKATIHEMVIYPLQHVDKAKVLGLRAGGGVLLYGPPGTGKTLLGKAIATELDCPFYYASGAQIRSKWHGESEQRLSQLIQAAQNNPLAVLFFDEVEGLLPRRTSGSSVVDNRVVTQFLADIGGFKNSDNILLILGATNKPWDIDEAVFRTGRFDEKIYIGIPDQPARKGILEIHLKEIPLDESFQTDAWVDRFEGYTGSDIVGIVNAAKRAALSRSIRDNADPCITNPDMETAFRGIPSSVTPKMLKEYERFREQRFGV